MSDFRPFAATVCAILAGIVLATPSLAAKPVPPSGTIELAEPGGLRAFTADPWPMFGDKVTYNITFKGTLTSKSRLSIMMYCMQGDGVVYQWPGDVNFAFPLINQNGAGLYWDGGEAICTASLMYRETKGKKSTVMILDQDTFPVAAAP